MASTVVPAPCRSWCDGYLQTIQQSGAMIATTACLKSCSYKRSLTNCSRLGSTIASQKMSLAKFRLCKVTTELRGNGTMWSARSGAKLVPWRRMWKVRFLETCSTTLCHLTTLYFFLFSRGGLEAISLLGWATRSVWCHGNNTFHAHNYHNHHYYDNNQNRRGQCFEHFYYDYYDNT